MDTVLGVSFSPDGRRAISGSSDKTARLWDLENGKELQDDLRRIQRLIQIGRPLTPEARLREGNRVRVRTGIFAGFEGVVIRRESQIRLLVAVDFTQQGASVLLDDCQLECID